MSSYEALKERYFEALRNAAWLYDEWQEAVKGVRKAKKELDEYSQEAPK
jgi:hypothetical protein